MSALTSPHLEKLLAMALDRAEVLERERSSLNLRVLELETQRDVAEDQRDQAIARAQGASHACSAELRHQAAQASVQLRIDAQVMKATGRTAVAARCEDRAQKLVEALR